MAWSKVLSSLERHLQKIKLGEDYDQETGLLHSAHVMCNAAFLTEYYKIYPQGDDRPHNYLNQPKIGLDIDEVLCDWVGGWIKKFGIETRPKNWDFTYNIGKDFDDLKKKGELYSFYLNLPKKIDSLPFIPHCYITSRSVPVDLTQKWLKNNGFPCRPVYSIGLNQSKVEVAKESGIDVFVDDRYKNFIELTNAGIFTYLMDAPHNQKHDVGFRRIKDLKEII